MTIFEISTARRLRDSIGCAPSGNRNLARIMRAAPFFLGIGMSAICFAQNNETGGQDHTGPLAKVIVPYVDNHEIAGAVALIANRDRVIDQATVGYADLANHRAMKSDDMFWIASMSKAMTAAAVMMLVDEGKISIDDPVEKYLPEFKGQVVSSTSDADSYSAQKATSEPVQKAPVKLEPSKHPITIREI